MDWPIVYILLIGLRWWIGIVDRIADGPNITRWKLMVEIDQLEKYWSVRAMGRVCLNWFAIKFNLTFFILLKWSDLGRIKPNSRT